MAIATDPIQNWAAQAQAAAEAQQKKDQTLGIDSFLTLMTAQLKNQDPLKPLEGTEFISQLAQFGTVSGVQEHADLVGNIGGVAALDADVERLDHDRPRHSRVGRQLRSHPGRHGRRTDRRSLPARRPCSCASPTRAALWFARFSSRPPKARRTLLGMVCAATARRPNRTRTTSKPSPPCSGETGSLEVLMAGRVSSVSLDATGNNLSLNTSTLGSISDGRRASRAVTRIEYSL